MENNVRKMMSNKLEWASQQHRRKVSSLAMLFKILNGKVIVDSSQLTPAPPRQRRGHSRQLTLIQCRTASKQASFFPATYKDWNDLPEGTVTTSTPCTLLCQECHMQTPAHRYRICCTHAKQNKTEKIIKHSIRQHRDDFFARIKCNSKWFVMFLKLWFFLSTQLDPHNETTKE